MFVHTNSSLYKSQDSDEESRTKPFRLNVKRRLNKKHEEAIKALAEAGERKAELERLYQALIAEYRILLARVAARP